MKRKPRPDTLLGARGLPIGYLNMPKAACTSIKNILYFLNNGTWYEDPLHIHKAIRNAHRNGLDSVVLSGKSYLSNKALLLSERALWLNFTFVRDPGLRAYSAFIEKIWNAGKYSFPGIRKHLVDNNLLPSYTASTFDSVAKNDLRFYFCNFLRFVIQNLKGHTPFHPNPHWCVQSERIRQCPESQMVSFIGRVERFVEDMGYVLAFAGCNQRDLVDKRFNEGPRPPFTLNEILDHEVSDLLYHIYERDYVAFGYTLESGPATFHSP